MSTVVGTPNTLSHLHGSVVVGSQPCKGILIRALADMMLVGVEGYVHQSNRAVPCNPSGSSPWFRHLICAYWGPAWGCIVRAGEQRKST